MIRYRQNPAIHIQRLRHPIVEYAEGGRLYLDQKLLDLLDAAHGCSLDEILRLPHGSKISVDMMRAAIACLAEANLLLRNQPQEPQPVKIVKGGLVSAIIVTYNAGLWLKICLESIFAQTYQPIEWIVVDNASSDQTCDQIEQLYPQVRLTRLTNPVSLACALNIGAAQAAGEYLLLLNQDIRLEPDAVAELVARLEESPTVAAAAPKLRLFYTPPFLNGIGNQVGTLSWGWDNGLGHLDLGQFDSWKQVPSACFAVTLISRKAWNQVGPLDEKYPMYYEDSDWSYRARLSGFSIVAAPKAVGFHGYSQTGDFPQGRAMTAAKLRNVTYGRLRFSWKIFSARSLVAYFPGFIIFELFFLISQMIKGNFQLISSMVYGWKTFIRNLEEISTRRATIQSTRKITDQQLTAQKNYYPSPLIWNGIPELTWDLVQTCYLPLFISGKSRMTPEFNVENRKQNLLIISNDIIAEKMAGTGSRYLEISRALAQSVHVTLAVPVSTTLRGDGFEIISYHLEQPESLLHAAQQADIILASTFLLEKFPFLRQASKRLIIDLFDPTFLENLFYYASESMNTRMVLNQRDIQVTSKLAVMGDFYLCANERQRDFWLGFLAAAGRINPVNFDQDPSFQKLIGVVGTGISTFAPQPNPDLWNIFPTLPRDADIVLWGGGIWNWLDPVTLIKAWPGVIRQHPNARLIFLGTRHPNASVPEQDAVNWAYAKAKESGELDRTILFLEWIPYELRGALLLEARMGVVLHSLHIETHFSSRTRVFDCIWANLPILMSDGDELSQFVRNHQLGMVVPPGDVDAVEQAILQILCKPKLDWLNAFQQVQNDFNWKTLIKPLEAYCIGGKPAPDRNRLLPRRIPLFSKIRSYGLRITLILRQEGVRRLGFRVRKAVQARLTRWMR
jgi:GT2 family glycosyltransferase/glycosyltransferase involved in cell wall biosynthesis